MSFYTDRLPRRYAQRMNLRRGYGKDLAQDRSRSGHSSVLTSRRKKKPQINSHDTTADDLISDSDADLGLDPKVDSNGTSDSGSEAGYSSSSSLTSEAEHYRKIKADFVTAGPNLANPCETTKAMMNREEKKWKW
jgi:hypothetical protein